MLCIAGFLTLHFRLAWDKGLRLYVGACGFRWCPTLLTWGTWDEGRTSNHRRLPDTRRPGLHQVSRPDVVRSATPVYLASILDPWVFVSIVRKLLLLWCVARMTHCQSYSNYIYIIICFSAASNCWGGDASGFGPKQFIVCNPSFGPVPAHFYLANRGACHQLQVACQHGQPSQFESI